MESPGRSRTFRFARASAGITLLATPAESTVGAMVSRIIAFHSGLESDTTRCACSPRSEVSIERIHFAVSHENVAALVDGKASGKLVPIFCNEHPHARVAAPFFIRRG